MLHFTSDTFLRRNEPICRNVFPGYDLSDKCPTLPLFNNTSYLRDFYAYVLCCLLNDALRELSTLGTPSVIPGQSMSSIWVFSE